MNSFQVKSENLTTHVSEYCPGTCPETLSQLSKVDLSGKPVNLQQDYDTVARLWIDYKKKAILDIKRALRDQIKGRDLVTLMPDIQKMMNETYEIYELLKRFEFDLKFIRAVTGHGPTDFLE